MTTYDRALQLVDTIAATGIAATCDPRSVTPPCALLSPPPLTFDVGCGATAIWGIWLLAPGPANADAWTELDRMLSLVAGVLDVERSDFLNYSPSADASPLPAYRVQITEGVDV